MGTWSDGELAAVIASSAYERAATALAAGFEECDEHQALTELQKATLLRTALANFQGLDREIISLLGSADSLQAALRVSPLRR